MSVLKNKLSLVAATLSLSTIFSAAFSDQAKAASIDVTEIDDYTQIYQLDIVNSNFNSSTPAYNVDNSGTVFPNGIERIGYYLELDNGSGSQWVWASMDAFTQDLSLIGVPTFASGAVWQQNVSNMNVESNVSSIVTGTGITTGNIEFWPNNYGQENVANVPGASGSIYDFGDRRASGGNYGSMQIHNYGASQTLFAWNAWGRGDFTDDLGIGNRPNSHPDWTFAGNINSYTVRNLEIFVQPTVSANIPESSFTLGLLTVGGIFSISRLKKNLVKS